MKIPAVVSRLRTGESVELRSPDAADASAVLDFIRALSREASRNINHPPEFFEAMTVEAEASFLESCAAHPTNFFIAAFLGAAVVGTANISTSGASVSRHCAELGLGVLAMCREKGLGRRLMETLIENAQQNGVWNLQLRVRTFNEPAIALYDSLGFRRVGVLQRVAHLDDGFADEYVYQREGAASRLAPEAAHALHPTPNRTSERERR
ncbi:MAG TPA: GNAT family N-acetyltransferase [Labilithrix sp.]|jgi:L-amino acid N-acyltransferase YncA|nr:GNAT family N-acetyltransferase [Labilithrix sp.]